MAIKNTTTENKDAIIDSIVKKHENEKNIISVLQTVQEAYGFIPEHETAIIAKRLDIPLVKLWGVGTFYSQFKFKARGKYLIQVCNGTACHVNNSSELIEFLKEKLDIEEGETTSDGRFTLELVNCIGACARAPAIMINGKVYGNLTKESTGRIIDTIN